MFMYLHVLFSTALYKLLQHKKMKSYYLPTFEHYIGINIIIVHLYEIMYNILYVIANATMSVYR